MTTKFILITILYTIIFITVQGQDELMKELEAITPKENPVTIATFKGTRLINLHTIETLSKGSLDFRISHRFSDVSSGARNLWGLDGPAVFRLGLDYSLTNRFVIGIGRTSYQKMFDGFVKYKLIRQAAGRSPVSLVTLGSINIITENDPDRALTGENRYHNFSNRMSYTAQVLIARKLNRLLSLQLTPVYIHYNLINEFSNKNDMVSLALSGRYKFSKRLSLTTEYVARLTNYTNVSSTFKNVLGIGLDIETGGHVFQLFFTNAGTMNEAQLIPYTTNHEYRFGFNISRVFEFGERK